MLYNAATLAQAEPRWFGSVDSTNDLARRLYREQDLSGVLIAADTQTAGRGRRGREWRSPPGLGLYASVLLIDQALLSSAVTAPFVGGLAVAHALAMFAPNAPVRLKWPNDILIGDAKVAGVLTEIASTGSQPEFLVMGIGVNLLHTANDLPTNLPYPASSLAMSAGISVAPRDFAPALSRTLSHCLRLAVEQRARFWETYLAWWGDGGRYVRIVEGEEVISEGVAASVNEDGALLIDTPHGKTIVLSGTLRYASDGG